jgi:O-antigen/teichoic acid export membrane protein
LLKHISNFFSSGNPRTVKLKRNVGASFIIKGVSIVLGLVKIPILLTYLDSDKYGVWLTIASIIMWVQHFDLGLGHGLRNKFAEALAIGDKKRAKGLVSTAYISMTAIMLFLFIVLLPVVYVLDWNSILNVDVISLSELRHTVAIVLLMFASRFVFQLITIILKADQRPAISDVFLPLASLISLVIVVVLKYFVEDSLFWASAAIALPPVLVLIFGNIYFFKKDYSYCKPAVNEYNKTFLKDIYSLGLKFFVGQMLMIIMFQSSNLILIKIVNPEEVTIFNIAKTYFHLPLTFFMIILTPYWSAITEAYVKDEYEWIKRSMYQLKKIAVLFSGGLILMLLLSDFAFKIWIGDKIAIPFDLCIAFTIYNIIVLFLSPYNIFINGVGKLNLGLRIAVYKSITFLPVAIYFVKIYGAIGLVIALFIVNSLPNVIFNITQYKKIINRTAKGIWNR